MKQIVIFDLDDCLISSEAKVKVVSSLTKKCYRELTPAEFNNHLLTGDLQYDFTDFDCPVILSKAKLHKPTFDELLDYFYNTQIDIAILTARGNKAIIGKFFERNGIIIDSEFIFAVSSPNCAYTGSISERKAQVMKDLITAGYTEFLCFDDCEKNIAAFESFKSDTVRIGTKLVKHE